MTVQKQSTVLAVRNDLIKRFRNMLRSTDADTGVANMVDYLLSEDAIADSYFDEVESE